MSSVTLPANGVEIPAARSELPCKQTDSRMAALRAKLSSIDLGCCLRQLTMQDRQEQVGQYAALSPSMVLPGAGRLIDNK